MVTKELHFEQLVDKAEQLEDRVPDEALRCWENALRYRKTPYALCRFGSLAIDLGRAEEGRNALLQAIELAPDFVAPYVVLGIFYLENSDYASALIYLQKSLALEESAATYTLLGVVQANLGMTETARWSYKKAIHLDPQYEEAYYNLALTFRNEQPAEALSLFERALELDPDYEQAHRELGYTLRKLDRFLEAETHLRHALELDSSDGWAHIYLGNVLWAIGDLLSAEQSFKRAIETWPDSSIPYWSVAHFYEYQNRREESEFYYGKALQIDPWDEESNLKFGLYLKDRGDDSKAREYLERADPADKRVKAAIASLKPMENLDPKKRET